LAAFWGGVGDLEVINPEALPRENKTGRVRRNFPVF